jgi:hypothetical protein
MPELALMTPKINIVTNIKMYSSAEKEGEIHPDALMPGRAFTSSLNMLNAHGVTRKLSKMINFGAL